MIAAIWKISEHRTLVLPGKSSLLSGRKGFTLLELLLAVGLLGVILGMTFPRITAVRSTFLAAEAERSLANAVRMARISAVRQRTPVALTVSDEGWDRLQERRLQGRDWPAEDFDPLDPGAADWTRVWDSPVVRSCRAGGTVAFLASQPGIVFFPNGTSTGGEILVSDEAGAVIARFLVDPLTGEVFSR